MSGWIQRREEKQERGKARQRGQKVQQWRIHAWFWRSEGLAWGCGGQLNMNTKDAQGDKAPALALHSTFGREGARSGWNREALMDDRLQRCCCVGRAALRPPRKSPEIAIETFFKNLGFCQLTARGLQKRLAVAGDSPLAREGARRFALIRAQRGVERLRRHGRARREAEGAPAADH